MVVIWPGFSSAALWPKFFPAGILNFFPPR